MLINVMRIRKTCIISYIASVKGEKWFPLITFIWLAFRGARLGGGVDVSPALKKCLSAAHVTRECVTKVQDNLKFCFRIRIPWPALKIWYPRCALVDVVELSSLSKITLIDSRQSSLESLKWKLGNVKKYRNLIGLTVLLRTIKRFHRRSRVVESHIAFSKLLSKKLSYCVMCCL